ncbi:hypothetical protein [Roseibium sp.]|uniref:hypothetical protein n=1 Tax=Roseibium sp. TaxID=1936156 RepID=UPI003BA9048C
MCEENIQNPDGANAGQADQQEDPPAEETCLAETDHEFVSVTVEDDIYDCPEDPTKKTGGSDMVLLLHVPEEPINEEPKLTNSTLYIRILRRSDQEDSTCPLEMDEFEIIASERSPDYPLIYVFPITIDAIGSGTRFGDKFFEAYKTKDDDGNLSNPVARSWRKTQSGAYEFVDDCEFTLVADCPKRVD